MLIKNQLATAFSYRGYPGFHLPLPSAFRKIEQSPFLIIMRFTVLVEPRWFCIWTGIIITSKTLEDRFRVWYERSFGSTPDADICFRSSLVRTEVCSSFQIIDERNVKNNNSQFRQAKTGNFYLITMEGVIIPNLLTVKRSLTSKKKRIRAIVAFLIGHIWGLIYSFDIFVRFNFQSFKMLQNLEFFKQQYFISPSPQM